MSVILGVVKVDNTRERFSTERLEMLAEDLESFTELQEDVYGGDLTGITAAMQEAVEQIDVPIHEIPTPQPGNASSQIVNRINDVRISICICVSWC